MKRDEMTILKSFSSLHDTNRPPFLFEIFGSEKFGLLM